MEGAAVELQVFPGRPLADGSAPIGIKLATQAGMERASADICCVIDVSGSMGADAVVQGEGTGAATNLGLSVLDIVKHSMKTIIKNMAEGDRLALVAYSNNAEKVLELTAMGEAGRAAAEVELDKMQPGGMTNLWDGLKMGIEMLKEGQAAGGRLQHIMLFTDGCPNINPPRGILPMFQRLKIKEGGQLPCTVSTFGFGYELDSELLSELATSGCGMYGFIPDAGFVGTVFVNALANLLVTFAKDVTLIVKASNGAKFTQGSTGPVMGGHPYRLSENELTIELGSLQFGQAKDVVIRAEVPDGAGDCIHASLNFNSPLGAAPPLVKAFPVNTAEPKTSVDTQCCRLAAVDALRNAIRVCKLTNTEKAQGKEIPLPEAVSFIQAVQEQIELTKAQPDVDEFDTADLASLNEDLKGQVAEALSKVEWYTKWGIHYLPSLMLAHQAQVCTNFKDAGVQNYGGDLFGDIREKADDVFCSMPPPQPSVRAALAVPAAAAYTPPAVNMSMYYNCGGG